MASDSYRRLARTFRLGELLFTVDVMLCRWADPLWWVRIKQGDEGTDDLDERATVFFGLLRSRFHAPGVMPTTGVWTLVLGPLRFSFIAGWLPAMIGIDRKGRRA